MEDVKGLARVICGINKIPESHPRSCSECWLNDTCTAHIIAQRAISAGYGNVEQAVKEFVDSKVKPLLDEMVEIMFDCANRHCLVPTCNGPSNERHCHEYSCIEKNKQIWKSKVDNLIKELYGKGEA